MLFSEIKKVPCPREPFASDYFASTLININNEDIEIDKENMEFDDIILESLLMEDVLLLGEGTNDYIKSIIKYLNSSLKYIDDMWNKFNLEHNLAKRDTARFVGSMINGLDPSVGSTFSGYIYSIRDENIHIDRYLNQPESMIRRQLASKDFRDLEQIAGDENYFDTVRGKMTGSSGRVPAELFQKELFRHYRSGRIKPTQITVDNDVKEMMIDSLFEGDTHLSYCSYFKNNIISYIKSVIEFFKKLESLSVDKTTAAIKNSTSSLASDTVQLNSIYQLAELQIKISRKLIHIYTLAFSAKLDAINERQRLYTAAVKKIMNEQRNLKAERR